MEFDIRKYLRLVFRWWWLLVIGAIVPTMISYHFLSQQPSIYQARVILMVGATMQSANPNASDMGIAQRLARGYAEIARYGPVMNETIERLGLQRSPEVLAGQISTAIRPEANLLEIYVTDMNPQAAAAIANTLAEVLIDQTPAARTQGEQQRFVERQLNDLRAKIEKIEQEIEEQAAGLSDLSSAAEIRSAQENLASLEAVASRYRSEYALYLQSYVGESVNQLTIVEPAAVPTDPKGDRKVLVLGVAGSAGVGLALGGVFLIEYLDDTLKWDEVREGTLLGLPVLGGVRRMATSTNAVLNRPEERSPEAESLRVLRANVLLRRLRHPFQTVLVISPGPQEGKSFCASNLSVSLAATGLQVVVVDGDMRKPTLHQVFDLPNVFGLADLLTFNTPVSDLKSLKGLQETGLQNLHLLSAGKTPMDPLSLLMAPNFPTLVECLCERADIVVFDAPPMLSMSDATVLASHTDVSILVVAHGMTTRSQLEGVRTHLREHSELDMLGVVVNQVKSRERGAYYYYYDRKPFGVGMKRLWDSLTMPRKRSGLSPDDPARLLSMSEAAEVLGISRTMARRWGKMGRLPVVRQGLRRGVRLGDLRALVDLEVDGSIGWLSRARGNGRDGFSVAPMGEEDEEVRQVRWSEER